jgi:transcriptional regulator with XRE-family HTH domain
MPDPRPLSKRRREQLQRELKRWLDQHKMTQAELAERLDVSLRTVQHWHGGTRGVPPFLPLALRAVAEDVAEERR